MPPPQSKHCSLCVYFQAFVYVVTDTITHVNTGYLFINSNGENYLIGYVGESVSLTLPQTYEGEYYILYQYAFLNNDKIESIIIPEHVIRNNEYSFNDCDSLLSIALPNDITCIPGYAFWSCDSLVSITMPDCVTSIGYRAFEGCRSLVEFPSPDKVTSIASELFNGCVSLENLVIGSGVINISDFAMYRCNRLSNIWYKGTETEWSNIYIHANSYLPINKCHFYSKGEPTLNADGTAYDGNYWHYDEAGNIVEWVYNPEE